jgi:hypothetical protein
MILIRAAFLLLFIYKNAGNVSGYEENPIDTVSADEDHIHSTPYVITYTEEEHFLTEVGSQNAPHFVMFYAPWLVHSSVRCFRHIINVFTATALKYNTAASQLYDMHVLQY